MAQERRTPRRPAMLEPADAEGIIGDSDPAMTSVLAHSSAWALLGVGDEDLTPDAVKRLQETVLKEGPGVIAEMWSRSPAFTLPGVLWRLYLLSEWFHRDRPMVERRYERGKTALVIPGLEHHVHAQNLGDVIDAIDNLLHGKDSEDNLADIISQGAQALRVIAAGDPSSTNWITNSQDSLAYSVTTRERALIKTANELDSAARDAQAGRLE